MTGEWSWLSFVVGALAGLMLMWVVVVFTRAIEAERWPERFR